MKVIKPGRLAILTRCFEHGRRFYMGVSALAFVPMGKVDTLLHEVAMWKFVGERLGKEGALDVGIPKSRGEYLINGKAYAPSGVPHPAFPVRARVGGLEKSLYVSGDRYWTGMSSTDPQPITEMPLDWAHAYGGPDFAKNPLGKGEVEVDIQGVKIRPLPNIESPRQLIDSPYDRPEPAGFGPLDISWPQRSSLAGTHDQHWLENLFPGFARDIDWAIHDIAARDQQRDGFWTGGERYEFENMHPSQAKLVGELPRFRARVFVSRSHEIGEPRPPASESKAAVKRPPARLDEITLALQTLWFFPDAESLVMIWHGSTFVAEEDGADILHLLAAAEHTDRPRTREYYVQAIADRMHPEYALLAMLREDELLPEDLGQAPSPTDEDAQLNATEGLGKQNLHRRMEAETDKARAIVASYGLDLDVHGPAKVPPLAPPPKPSDIPLLVEKLKKDAAAKQADLEAKLKVAQADIDKIVDDAKIPGFTSQTVRDEMAAKPVGPPTWTAIEQLAVLQRIAMDCRSKGVIADELETIIADKEMFAQWQEAERNMKATYRLQAHVQPPAPAMPAELRDPTRARVRQALAEREDFATLNLTGADLSRMNLAGADLSNAFLESVKLDGSDLRGTNLTNAVLAHASLEGTLLDGATLTKANLGKARLRQTSLVGADLRDAILNDAGLDEAKLDEAQLDRVSLMGARFTKVSARAVRGERLMFVKVTLDHCDFSAAQMPESVFLDNDLRGSIFDRARLQSCTFLGCKAQKVSFFAADLGNARFVEGTELDGAVFTEAKLIAANLRGLSLVGADFRKAVLDRSDFSECNLADAKLYQVVARGTKFEVADLRNAELMSANLMHASFARAVIYGADLRGANLHGADMARVRTDASVQLDQALLTKVRIHPRHVDREAPKSP